MTLGIKHNKKYSRIQKALYIMIFPSVILTLIYSYGPLAGLSIAFQDYQLSKGLFGSDWIGLANFQYIFSLPNFWSVVRNTLSISVMKLITGMAFPIFISILLNEMKSIRLKKGIQTAIYLPHFISWVIVSGILIDMLSPSTGVVNKVITALGGESVFFLGDKNVFPFTLVVSNIWKEFGFGTIIYLASLTNISPSLYEAAKIDGANRWHGIWHITLPGIMPIIVLMGTLNLGQILNAGFDQVFNLYSPMVYSTGDILDTLSYRIAFQSNGIPLFEVATAVGMFKAVISLFFVSTSYWLAYKIADYKIF